MQKQNTTNAPSHEDGRGQPRVRLEQVSGQFDQELFEKMLRAPSRSMQVKHQDSLRRTRQEYGPRRKEIGFYSAVKDSEISILRGYVEDVDRICREVWSLEGKPVSTEFIRLVCQTKALQAIAVRHGVIKSTLELMARRARFTGLAVVLRQLALDIGALSGEISERYEIEARTLAHRADGQISATRDELNSVEISADLKRQYQPSPTRERSTKLSPREMRIWNVIKQGVKGLKYCAALDRGGVRPPRTGLWKDGPGKYTSAYREGEPWRHRIQDEKYKVRKKARETRWRVKIGQHKNPHK